ncbi:MAG: hypothetical protein R3Y60_04935 [bacterium]
MEKTFKIQKVLMVAAILAVVTTFIYSLYFMTDYALLGVFDNERYNGAIINFHDGMQSLNFTTFYVAIAGFVLVASLVGLQCYRKVCDKIAMIAIGVLSTVQVGGILYSVLQITGLRDLYTDPTFLDNVYKEQVSSWTYNLNVTTLNAGLIIYPIVITIFIGLIAITIFNHFKFLKQNVGENNG